MNSNFGENGTTAKVLDQLDSKLAL